MHPIQSLSYVRTKKCCRCAELSSGRFLMACTTYSLTRQATPVTRPAHTGTPRSSSISLPSKASHRAAFQAWTKVFLPLLYAFEGGLVVECYIQRQQGSIHPL